MKATTLLAALAAAAAPFSLASAQVVYSHYEYQSFTAIVTPGYEVAEFVTPVGGAQLISRAEFQIASFNPTSSSGTITLNFYNDGGNVPGALISSFSQPLVYNGAGPSPLSFSTGSLSLPASFWAAIRYVPDSGFDTVGVPVFGDPPTVGTIGQTRGFRNGNSGPWGTATVTAWMSMRLTAGASCYANCDGSTVPPILNVNDFICFQTKYAAGDSAANCDGSTTPPILNVNDFICFQTRYAAGCP